MEFVIIAVFILLIIGAAFLSYRLGQSKQQGFIMSLEKENDMLKNQIDQQKKDFSEQLTTAKKEAAEQFEREKAEDAQILADAKKAAEELLSTTKEESAKALALAKEEAMSQLSQQKEDAAKALTSAKEESAKLLETTKKEMAEQQNALKEEYEAKIKENQKFLQEQLPMFKEKVENATATLLKDRQQELQQGNQDQMKTILQPVFERLKEMNDLIDKNREGNDKNSAAITASIRQIVEHSQLLGNEAHNLTEALKNKGKVQGDWGEQILTGILEESGLREGQEYVFQYSVKDADGADQRPDVIVKLPGADKKIIIDSKVTLTAFYNYLNASTAEEQEQAEKDNLRSIQNHINELARKDYSKVIKDAAPIVFLFIPNEGSYILAMNKDPRLGQKAYNNGVLIINPTNLMLTLQLVSILWNKDRQEENCEKILKMGTDIYDKFVNFADSFQTLGNQLNTAQRTYSTALGQLQDGKGNLKSRIQKLTECGISVTKQIPEIQPKD